MKTSYSLMLLSSKYKNPMNIQLDQKATQIPRNPNLAKRAKKKTTTHYFATPKIQTHKTPKKKKKKTHYFTTPKIKIKISQ